MKTIPVVLNRAGSPNKNGRLYSAKVWEKALAKLPEGKTVQLKHRMETFQEDWLNNLTLTRRDVVGSVSDLKLEGPELVGSAHVPDDLEEKLRSGEIAVRTAGMGAFEDDGVTITDYELMGCFLTKDPA